MKKLRSLFTFPINIISLVLLLILFFAIDTVLAAFAPFDSARVPFVVTEMSDSRFISDTLPVAIPAIIPLASPVITSTSGADSVDAQGDVPQSVTRSVTQSAQSVSTPPLPVATSFTAPVAAPVATLVAAPVATPISIPLQPTRPTSPSTLSSSANPLDTTTNILVLGSDQRMSDTTWRTDVIMIIALDNVNGRAGVISIPRDVYLEDIPLHQPNRINVVDYLGQYDDPDGGGPALMASILEEKLEIEIDYYIRFGFESFKDLVDELGGVEVVLDCPVSDEIPAENISIDLPAGPNLLDGSQALSFVRTRRQGGDLARVRRQQRLVWALRQQMREENWLPRVPILYRTLSTSVQTDIGLIKSIDLARFVMNLDESQVYGLTLASPQLLEEAWRDGMLILLLDWAGAAEMMQNVFERAQFEETNTVGPEGDRAACP